MEKSIKPIETKYNGFRFRSRLEARWAVFFDMIGLKYEYEVEGFEMNGIRYLPDFYIPSLDRWFEIKGKPLSEYEMKKCEEFCFNKDNENIKFSVFVHELKEHRGIRLSAAHEVHHELHHARISEWVLTALLRRLCPFTFTAYIKFTLYVGNFVGCGKWLHCK